MSKKAWAAMRRLYDRVYELDKEFSFRSPDKKAELQWYYNKVHSHLWDAFEEAGVSKVHGHEVKPKQNNGSNKGDQEE